MRASRKLAFPQRRRILFIPDKEADGGPNRRRSGLAILLCHRALSGPVKRKERPPKDARPKEKRFRHGGRKGRRARLEQEKKKS
jgi:hypothetical protein